MRDPATTDILVVGGGPAGLLAAETAASGSCSVAVVEREKEIGRPVHTSGGTTSATMREFGIPDDLFHVVPHLRLRGPKQEARFDIGDSGCVIDVTGVYQHLAQRAESAGATVKTGTQARSPLFESDAVVGCEVESASGEVVQIRSKIVIDAGGYRSPIAKAAGLHEGFRRFGVGAEVEFIAPHCDQEEAFLFVGSKYAPGGYGWVFPWGKRRVRVGVGIIHSDSKAKPDEQVTRFIDDAAEFGVNLTGATEIERHFGLIPSDGLAERFVGNGLMAVGDAAGQASLVVGEGIRISVVAGRMAGRVAANAVRSGRFDRESLAAYEAEFRSTFSRNLVVGELINRSMARWDNDKWDERVRLLGSVPAPLALKLLQSEFPLRELAPWLARNPALWPTTARYAFKAVTSHR